MNRFLPTTAFAALALAGSARADESTAGLAPVNISLDLAAAYTRPDPPADPPAEATEPATAESPADTPAMGSRETRFGRAGSRWWSIGSGIASNFSDDTDINIHGIYSTFLTDSVEFGVEAAGWYFNQEGDDTGGISGSMILRWHFWHWDTDFRWGGGPNSERYRNTFFLDAGIGLLAGFSEVPEGGTAFNFLPRVGAGYTHALTEDEAGSRLTVGLRWHHISNARIEGDERNPARDSLMIYAEIQFPF